MHEVAVSCFAEPPGWMRWKDHMPAKAPLKWNTEALSTMTKEIYCARVLREFLQCTISAIDDKCQVIDYEDIDRECIEDVARSFDIKVTAEGSEAIKASMSVYSKDPLGKRVFSKDKESKQSLATEAIHHAIKEWTRGTYEQLMLLRSKRAVPCQESARHKRDPGFALEGSLASNCVSTER